MVRLASLDAPIDPNINSIQIGTKHKRPTSTATPPAAPVDDNNAQVKLNELFAIHFLPIFYELTASSSSVTSDQGNATNATNSNNGKSSTNGASKSSTGSSVVWSREVPQMAAFDALIRLVPAQAWVHHERILSVVIPQVKSSSM